MSKVFRSKSIQHSIPENKKIHIRRIGVLLIITMFVMFRIKSDQHLQLITVYSIVMGKIRIIEIRNPDCIVDPDSKIKILL